MKRTSQFPADLARHVAARLAAETGCSPPQTVLIRLLETLYFASLKTEEGRPPVCTINFFDPRRGGAPCASDAAADCWSEARFDSPLPLDIRSLTKLARAADPAFSSLAVTCDRKGDLFIRGLIDQELHYSDFIALDARVAPRRPGLFQVTITGVGNLSVYNNYSLIGSLEQHTLVQEYHDVLWHGPVHALLEGHCRSYLAERGARADQDEIVASRGSHRAGILVRWLNAICRILMNVQQYKHGGGLLITPAGETGGLNVKYRIRYDRLPSALLGIDRSEHLRGRVAAQINHLCQNRRRDLLPSELHFQHAQHHQRFDEHKSEVLGCAHFIASLSCVDGFVLLDRHLRVRGFGVEVRSGEPVENIAIAGDPLASPDKLRRGELEPFGTRHRAMMRYCYENPGSLGFVVSQDGDIRAMLRIGQQLVLWENIEVQLAFRSESGMLIRHEGGTGEAAVKSA
jgi:hypothetical protein